jgi:hypothetical protein
MIEDHNSTTPNCHKPTFYPAGLQVPERTFLSALRTAEWVFHTGILPIAKLEWKK